MLRPIFRSSPAALRRASPRLIQTSRRFITTRPADRPRTWRSSALRWGAAVAAVYWYNTSPIFADEPAPQTVLPPPTFSSDDQQTVDAIIDEKRRKVANTDTGTRPETTQDPAAAAPSVAADTALPADGVEALEEEADQQGAFNPETGEINWDCPCLGGMAHGPCGEEFKTAFSCFVYSNEEPKGMDCIEKFQGMQDCFRQYPEIYGAELTDDGADEEQAALDDANPPPHADDGSDGAAKDSSLQVESGLTEKVESDQSTPAPKTKDSSEAASREATPPTTTKSAATSDESP